MEGGDLKTLPRQHGGIFGLLGKLFGLGPGELQKQMSDPIKQQMLMQRWWISLGSCWIEFATNIAREGRTRPDS